MQTIDFKTLNLSSFRSSLFSYFNDDYYSGIVLISKRGQNKKALIDLDLLEDLLESNDPELAIKLKNAKSEDRLTHDQVFGDI